MFAVVVTFKIKSGQMDQFMQLMLENARSSVADEPECHQFDVCTDTERPDTVFLYEVYSDLAGFDAHRQTPHYKRFDSAVGAMIGDKDVRTFATVHQ